MEADGENRQADTGAIATLRVTFPAWCKRKPLKKAFAYMVSVRLPQDFRRLVRGLLGFSPWRCCHADKSVREDVTADSKRLPAEAAASAGSPYD